MLDTLRVKTGAMGVGVLWLCLMTAAVNAQAQAEKAEPAAGPEEAIKESKETGDGKETKKPRLNMQLNAIVDKGSGAVVTPRYPAQVIGFTEATPKGRKLSIRNVAYNRVLGEVALPRGSDRTTVISSKGDLVGYVVRMSESDNVYLVTVFSTVTRKEVKTFKVTTDGLPILVDFAGDERLIIYTFDKKMPLQSLNLKTGESALVGGPAGLYAGNDAVAPFTVSPDGTLLAVLLMQGKEGEMVVLYDTKTMTKVERKFVSPKEWMPWSVRFTPDSSKLVVLASNPGDSTTRPDSLDQIITFDAATGAVTQSVAPLFKIPGNLFNEHKGYSQPPVQFSADSQLALIMGQYVCSGSTFELIYKPEFNNYPINAAPNLLLGNDYLMEAQLARDKQTFKCTLFQLPYAKVKKALDSAGNTGSTRDAGLPELKSVDLSSVKAGSLAPGTRVALTADPAVGATGVSFKQWAAAASTEKPLFFTFQQPGASRLLVTTVDPYRVREKGASTDFFSVDLKTKRFNGPIAGLPGSEQVCASPDCSKLTVVTPRLEGDRIDVFSTTTFFGRASGVMGFSPYPGRKIAWSRLVSPELLLTMSDAGEVAGWSLDPLKPLYRFEVDAGVEPLITPGGKHVLVSKDSVIYAFKSDTGDVIGPVAGPVEGLSAQVSRVTMAAAEREAMPKFGLALNTQGTKLAVSTFGRSQEMLTVWDLAGAGEPVTLNVGIPRWTAARPRMFAPVWVSDRLVRGRSGLVLDAQAYKVLAVAQEGAPLFLPMGDGATTLYIDNPSKRIVAGPSVPAETLAKMEKVSPEEMWYIDPGQKWEMVMEGNLPAAMKATALAELQKRAKQNNQMISDGPSENKMVMKADLSVTDVKETGSTSMEELDLSVELTLVSGRKDRLPIRLTPLHEQAVRNLSAKGNEKPFEETAHGKGWLAGRLLSRCDDLVYSVPMTFVDYEMLDVLGPMGTIKRPGSVIPPVTSAQARTELAQISKVLPELTRSAERLREAVKLLSTEGKPADMSGENKAQRLIATVRGDAKQITVTSSSVPAAVAFYVDQSRQELESACTRLEKFINERTQRSDWLRWQKHSEFLAAARSSNYELPDTVKFLEARKAILTELVKKP